MPDDTQNQVTSALSYLDASKVTIPAGVLSELDVINTDGQRIGSIEGVVIDAAGRHVRYLSVRLSGWLGRQRYLVQADQLGQIEGESKALRLLADLRNAVVHGLDATALRKFSEEDALEAMFSPRIA